MFLSVVILGRFTTETHAMALYVSIDTPPLLTPHPGTQPNDVAAAPIPTARAAQPIHGVSESFETTEHPFVPLQVCWIVAPFPTVQRGCLPHRVCQLLSCQ